MNKLGIFYFISRVVYPSMIYPDEPKQKHPINKVAIKSQSLIGNEFDRYGIQFMMHLRKKRN